MSSICHNLVLVFLNYLVIVQSNKQIKITILAESPGTMPDNLNAFTFWSTHDLNRLFSIFLWLFTEFQKHADVFIRTNWGENESFIAKPASARVFA